MRRALFPLLLAASSLACRGTSPKPVPLEAGAEPCVWCRMTVSNPRLAAQLDAPGEEPKFFDDVGCLRDYLLHSKAPKEAIAYVADHRTKAWIPAGSAVFTRCLALATPMGSHLVAHADLASRDADPDARGGESVPTGEVLGSAVSGATAGKP